MNRPEQYLCQRALLPHPIHPYFYPHSIRLGPVNVTEMGIVTWNPARLPLGFTYLKRRRLMATMYDPVHPWRKPAGRNGDRRLDRDRDGRQAGLHPANVLAAAEWPHRRLAGDGVGFGTPWVEQCRVLGPTPGTIRLGPRAVASGEGGRVTGKDDDPPAGACSDSPSRQTISLWTGDIILLSRD